MDYQHPFLIEGFESSPSEEGSYFHFYSKEIFAFMAIFPDKEIVLKGKIIDTGVEFYWKFSEDELEKHVLKLIKLKNCVKKNYNQTQFHLRRRCHDLCFYCSKF